MVAPAKVSKLQGLWSLPVHLLGGSFHDSTLLARIILNIMIFPGVLWAWYRQPQRGKNAFDAIKDATTILLAWYILVIVDLFLHEAEIKAAYGYILMEFFLACYKYAADILLLQGIHRIIVNRLYYCEEVSRLYAKIYLLVGEFQIIIIITMALYYLGSVLCNEVLWLEIASLKTLGEIEHRKNRLEAAYSAFRFILSLMILCGAGLMVWFEGDFDRHRDESQAKKAALATFALWIRSFSELIVNTHYHPIIPKYALATRDTIYGFLTIAILFLILPIGLSMTTDLTKSPLLLRMEEETRRYILEKVNEVIGAGLQVPVLSTVLQQVLQNPTRAYSAATARKLGSLGRDEQDERRLEHVAYVNGLMIKYGHLGPVGQAED